MMSLKSIRKGSVSQHRSTSFMRKTLKEQESSIALIKQIQLGLSKPYWIMHTLLSHGDTVDISKDTKREQEMKDIKSKWSESNPNRVRIGQQLRWVVKDLLFSDIGRAWSQHS